MLSHDLDRRSSAPVGKMSVDWFNSKSRMKTQPKRARITRRNFLRATASTVSALTLVPRSVLGGPKFVSPNERVNIAIVGAGGQGRTNVRALFNEPTAQIIAVCDPNEQSDYSPYYFKGMAGRKPVKDEIEKHYAQSNPGFRCAEYVDFRKLLEEEKTIDAVLCATPDHLHALVCITAMRLGKHVYCEKPLTHNIWEARLVARVAKETGVATQMGNQGHSGDGIRTTCEWLWDGAIGTVREVHAWSGAGGRWPRQMGRPTETPPVPAGLDWDLWLGTRTNRPYHPSYVPVRWRSYWEFGTGAIGDMGCHNLDPAFWALDLAAPASIEASTPVVDDYSTSPCVLVRYKFEARGTLPPIKVTWYDGGLLPERPEELPDEDPLGANNNGILFLGERGVIMCPGWGGPPRILPDEKMDAYKRPAKTLPRSQGHHRDWLLACKGGPPASSNFEYGARITELMLLGNVAVRTRKKIRWDSANMKITNVPEANAFLKDDYRKGWEIT
jgi:predicted dehydrogenase